MNIVEIQSAEDPRIAHYLGMRHFMPSNNPASDDSYFIAESPKVISSALDAGYSALSLLCERRHINGDAAGIISRLGDNTTIYTGSREVLEKLTGYTLTRGVLCAMSLPKLRDWREVVKQAARIAVLDRVCDTTNIGSIFRSAAALGVDGILLTPGTCDPLNRRSVRVSMGSIFKVPWAWINDPIEDLKKFGFKTMAMALKPFSIPLDSPTLIKEPRLAIIFGTEGDGLSNQTIEEADYSVIIPMYNGVDSLNVAMSASIAFWQLRKSKIDTR